MMIKARSLNPRDKTAVVIGSGIVALLLLAGGITATGTALRRLDRLIATRSQALGEIGQLRSEAQILQQQIRKAEEKLSRSAEASLVTFVEGMANRVAGRGNLAYLRPLASSTQDGMRIETLEMKLERQSLEQLLRLFWEIENAAVPMHITSLRMQRRFENRALLDATLTMDAYRK